MRQIGLLAGTLAILITSGVSAQTPAAKPGNLQERLRPPAPTSVQAVPQLTAEEKTALTPAKTPAQPGGLKGRSVALMIAGGALFVAGVLTDGDAGTVLMVSGAVIGAYGIYLHFR
jgi:hypothetical protein